MVGLSGVGVNLGVFHVVLWLTSGLLPAGSTVAFTSAQTVGILTSIASNFWLNDRWTWGDLRSRGSTSVWQRLVRFYAVAFVGAAMNLAVALTVRALWAPPETLSALAGIAAATLVNFTFNQIWTFRAASSLQEARATSPAIVTNLRS